MTFRRTMPPPRPLGLSAPQRRDAPSKCRNARLVLGLFLSVSACREQRTEYPPPPPPLPGATPMPATANPARSAAAAIPPLAPATPPPVLFQEGTPIHFRAGPALSVKLIARDAEVLALSPDGQSYVLYEHSASAKLVTPTNSAGFPVPAAASTQARFSPDGSLVAIYDSGVTLLEVPSGKKRLEVAGSPACGVGFTDGALVFQEEASAGNEWLAPLRRVSLTGGNPVAVGRPRFARNCEAATDGSAFVVTFPEPTELVDGRTGQSRTLVPEGSKLGVTVSPVADRYCVTRERNDVADLDCIHLADGIVEHLAIGASYPEIVFDPDGRRGLLSRTATDKRGEPYRELYLADFAARTLRRIDGFEPKSGSIPSLLPGGHLLAQGSRAGMMVYDLDRGQKRFITKARLYGAEPMHGHERRFFADAETFGGQDNAEVYSVEVP